MQEWRTKNKDHCKDWRHNRYEKHKEAELAANAIYCKENADRVNANAAKRYAADPQKFRDKVKHWQQTNPEKTRMILAECRARRKGARGEATVEQIEARIKYYGGCCAYCGGAFEHIDHVIALSLGGTRWPANLRPACQKCNLKKHAKSWRKWLKEIEDRGEITPTATA